MREAEKKFFPTTQWSLIIQAADDDPGKRDEALSKICMLYWPPVYAFIRFGGKSPSDAEDLTQGLFAQMLERGDFGKANPASGRLRTYLLSATRNYITSQFRHQQRQKRGGNVALLSIDALVAETHCLNPELTEDLTPDRAFDRQWAISLMEAVLMDLSEAYSRKGKSELFEALQPFIQTAGGQDSQKIIAANLGMSDQALRVAVHRLRQRYAEALRQAVKATLGSEESIEDEMKILLSAF